MNDNFLQPKLDYDWSDFFEIMKYNPIVNHIHIMMCRGDIKTTEQMLIGCICMLAQENESLRDELIDKYAKSTLRIGK